MSFLSFLPLNTAAIMVLDGIVMIWCLHRLHCPVRHPRDRVCVDL